MKCFACKRPATQIMFCKLKKDGRAIHANDEGKAWVVCPQCFHEARYSDAYEYVTSEAETIEVLMSYEKIIDYDWLVKARMSMK